LVSTEDDEIAEISKKYGAEVVKRPEEFARDGSPVIDAITHVIHSLEERNEVFDIVIMLEATSPLRKRNDIDNAIELFMRNMDKADSLVSVGEIHLEHPHVAKVIKDGFVRPLIKLGQLPYRRQQLPKVYFPYCVIYLSKVATLMKYKSFYQERTIPYFIERWQNYEIDDIWDFYCIEAIVEKVQAEMR
jgi:N-acylneuraminate cytidylyltransferase